MGLCMSSGGAAVRADHGLTAATAMVLLPTGELREYPRPATAARALEECSGSVKWFLCDADSMGFEGHVAAVGGAEELRPGRIYFVLPSEARRNGLRREDVAALAVRASEALVKKAACSTTGSGINRRRRTAGSVAPVVFAPPEEEEDAVVSYKTAPAAKRRPVARVMSAGRTRQRFAPDLSAISECDASERSVEWQGITNLGSPIHILHHGGRNRGSSKQLQLGLLDEAGRPSDPDRTDGRCLFRTEDI